MKKRKGDRHQSVGLALAICLIMAALSGCGSAGSKGMYAYEEAAMDTAAPADAGGGFYDYAEVAEEEAGEIIETQEGKEGPEVTEQAVSERKLIKNVNLDVETEQFDTLLPSIEQRVAALGGYIEEMSSYSRGNQYAKDYQGTKYLRYASITARVPRQNLEIFLEEIGEQTNVTSRSESVTDVTLQYVDLESHKKALLTEQDRLLELMEQAESVEDIIAIESRLSEVRYQIESMEAQLRTFDNKIDYSTVYLGVDEVERYSPSESASTGERIRRGFSESVEGVGSGIQDALIWFVINLPYLFVWIITIVIIIVIVRIFVKVLAKRAAKRTARQSGGHGRKYTAYNPYDPYAPYVPNADTAPDAPGAGNENGQSKKQDADPAGQSKEKTTADKG